MRKIKVEENKRGRMKEVKGMKEGRKTEVREDK